MPIAEAPPLFLVNRSTRADRKPNRVSDGDMRGAAHAPRAGVGGKRRQDAESAAGIE
jgi:hypothetical protein